MTILVDTSVVVATVLTYEPRHKLAVATLAQLRRRERLILPMPVLLEIFQVVASRLGYLQGIAAYNRTRASFDLVGLTDEDLSSMAIIMTKYADAEFDFADAAIMALAERLNITQIATFDHRDFGMYRPAHIEAFELLPVQ